jgi:DNA polymerase III subunit delta
MLIFLYGEDSFRSHQKLLGIKNKYLESDKSGSGLSLFDCEEKFSAEGIMEVFETPGLLSPKRLVIIKKIIAFGTETEQKKILAFLKKRKGNILDNKDLVAVFWEDIQPKKSNTLFKFLEGHGKKQNFEKLSGIKLDQWTIKRIKEINDASSISRPALSKLILYVSNNMEMLDNEIKKLVNYSGSDMISEKDVDTLVSANLDANIFATVDAIGANNKKEALFLLHRHLKKGDDPFYIFSMFLYQFRNLLKIADLKGRGISSEYEISKITKMHPYVIRKSLGQIRNFTFERLKKTYNQLGEIDNNIKTGKIDIKLALDKFVAEL